MPENGYPEDEVIQLSAIQHLAFCERQCYLIHVEQTWQDNAFTIAGDIAHERVDSQEISYTRDGLKQVRSLMLYSKKYGLNGRADLVEFAPGNGGVFPVEYKVGQPKPDDCDCVQLCAQAFCLEEMLGISVGCGAVYYGKTCQRITVELTAELRMKTEMLIRRVHDLFHQDIPPRPEFWRQKCRNCSLCESCFPQISILQEPLKYFHGMMEE